MMFLKMKNEKADNKKLFNSISSFLLSSPLLFFMMNVPIEQILPDSFHLDPTRGRFREASCPKCLKDNIVFGIYNGDDRMVTCLGCKNCHFRWWLGRRLVCKDFKDFRKKVDFTKEMGQKIQR